MFDKVKNLLSENVLVYADLIYAFEVAKGIELGFTKLTTDTLGERDSFVALQFRNMTELKAWLTTVECSPKAHTQVLFRIHTTVKAGHNVA